MPLQFQDSEMAVCHRMAADELGASVRSLDLASSTGQRLQGMVHWRYCFIPPVPLLCFVLSVMGIAIALMTRHRSQSVGHLPDTVPNFVVVMILVLVMGWSLYALITRSMFLQAEGTPAQLQAIAQTELTRCAPTEKRDD